MPPAAALPSEQEIATLVQLFYLKVERDEVLGPIFAPTLRDWPAHCAAMTDFWAAALLGRDSRCGAQSVLVQAPHPIAPLQFVRWLALFRATATDLLGAERGRRFLDKAERIAAGLQMGRFLAPASGPQPAGSSPSRFALGSGRHRCY